MKGDFCVTTRCVPDPERGDMMIETKVFQRNKGVITQLGPTTMEFRPKALVEAVMDRQHRVMVKAILEH